MSEPESVRLRIYKSAADIIASYSSGTEFDTWAEFEAERFRADGACIGQPGVEAYHDEAFVRGVVQETEDRRAWGFQCGGEIHFWFAPDAPLNVIADVLGHEVAHAHREPITSEFDASEQLWPEHYDAEEKIADSYGLVTAQTVAFLLQLNLIAPVAEQSRRDRE